MSQSAPVPAKDAETLPVHAWWRSRRLAAASLLAIGGASVPMLLAALALANDPPITPPVLLRLMLVQIAGPALVAAALRRASRATAEVRPGTLVIDAARRRIEVPRDAIAAVEPWRLPLPGPGVSLRLRSGRRLAWGLELRDPMPLLDALGTPAAAAARHPTMRWAHARGARPPVRGGWLLAKYPGFSLPFAVIFFNAHQHIAYGALLGQWYLEGPGPWLATLLVYWVTTTMYCVLWGGAWRGVVEASAWVVAAAAPAQAVRGRRAAEWLGAVGYYGGVAALTAARFLA